MMLELFWSFFQVGLFSIGGGYAALPLIQQQVVEHHPWLTMAEFADVITVAEMTPGPIAINAATFVGTRVGGLWGTLVATAGCVLPSLVIVLILAKVYIKYRNLKAIQSVLAGLRPAVVGMIAAAGLSIITMAFWGGSILGFAADHVSWIALVLFAVSFIALRKFKLNPAIVMLACGLVGGIMYGMGL